MKVQIELTEAILGTASGNKHVHEEYIALKAKDGS